MDGPLPGSLSRASCVILYSRMLPSSSVNIRWEIPRGLLKKKNILCVHACRQTYVHTSAWCIYGGQRTTSSTPSCFRQVLVCCCTQQASCPVNLHGFSPLCLHTGITAMSCWIWLYSISGDLNSGLHTCRASNLHPSPNMRRS